MNRHLSIAMFLLGACLALGFVYGMGKVSNAVAQFKRSNAIRVKGYAERQIKADTASWGCSVTVRDRELQTGYARMKRDVEACRKQALVLGVTETELSLGPIDTVIKYKRTGKGEGAFAEETNEIDYYELRQAIDVVTQDVVRADRVSKEITNLISTGIEVRSEPVMFTCSQLEKIKLEMIAEAAKNGRERAAALAERSQGTVGPLISADQGVFQIVPVNSTEVSGEGIYDTRTVDKTIKSVVTLEFAVSR